VGAEEEDSGAAPMCRLPGWVADLDLDLAWVAAGGTGAAGRTRPLSLLGVVESAEVILALVGGTAIGNGIGIGTVMEDGLGMRGIGVHRHLGESHRLRECRGVTVTARRGIDGRCLGRDLGLVRRHRGDGGSNLDVDVYSGYI